MDTYERYLKPGEVSTGTTIMAMAYSGGVVLAADSRTSSGSYIVNRTADKIVPLSDFIWCCRSGSAADTQALADYTKHYLQPHMTELGRLPHVKTVANLLKMIAYRNKDNLLAGLIVAGWDPYNGGQVFEITLGGTMLQQKFAMSGSGSSYLYGLVDAEYRSDLDKQGCTALLKKAVAHAMSRDGSSGGVIRLVYIDGSGVSKEVIPGDQLPYFA